MKDNDWRKLFVTVVLSCQSEFVGKTEGMKSLSYVFLDKVGEIFVFLECLTTKYSWKMEI